MQSFNRHLGNQDIGMILSFLTKKIITMNFLKLASSAGSVLPNLKNILKNCWNCFITDGIKRAIEFGIDTGSATPVCCKPPHHEPYESIVILKAYQSFAR